MRVHSSNTKQSHQAETTIHPVTYDEKWKIWMSGLHNMPKQDWSFHTHNSLKPCHWQVSFSLKVKKIMRKAEKLQAKKVLTNKVGIYSFHWRLWSCEVVVSGPWSPLCDCALSRGLRQRRWVSENWALRQGKTSQKKSDCVGVYRAPSEAPSSTIT